MDPTQKLLAAIATLGEACALRDQRIQELEQVVQEQAQAISTLSVPPEVARAMAEKVPVAHGNGRTQREEAP